MDLKAYQRAFIEALYADNDSLLTLVTAPTAHRFSAYHTGLRARFEESLLEAYPATERLLGHAAFHGLSQRYLTAYPSITWDLSRVGENFSAFLAGLAETQAHPYLPELARFEWLLHELFFVADDGATAPFPQDEKLLAGWKPRFSSTVRLFYTAWPVAELLTLAGEPQPGFSFVEKRSAYLLFRDCAETVRYWPLSVPQADLQAKLLQGQSLGEAIDAVEALEAPDLGNLSAVWTAHGLLRAPLASATSR